MASARMPATIPPIAPVLRLCEVTVIGSGGGEVVSGFDPKVGAVETGGVLPLIVLVVTEVNSVVFRLEAAEGEGTSIEVATPAVDVRTGTTEGDDPLTDVITAGAPRKLDGRMTISPSSGRYSSHSQGISSQPDLPAS